ncbi:class I SAM-dependent methyltransferase [Pontixanthobacter gangjinensis]|uniref:Class I SAM-dependent methyltransferase n=1 Tax=Christiangramia aestuarii TaxID=1028746 RepID=A0A7K1LLU8_9FLAO|nr:class I SAM-dependent methyltransferase [Christiangramia aestuarii]MUP41806.1 class I SAM-dependent methyltransferase [Christiangramia aestuarii]
MYFQLRSYLNFLLKSQNQHGLHSPFVYDLVTKCFYDKSNYEQYDLIKNYRNDLLRNKEFIEVTDFGAGSRVFKSNKRPVFSIAKNAGITLHRAKLLYRLTNYLKVDKALELGTSLGIASSAIAANKNTGLISIEGCPETANIARQQVQKYQLNNIRLRVNEFEAELDLLIRKNQKFDLVYLDGNHQKKATLDYFEKLLPSAHNDSIFIFDDIHWSEEMEEAWEEIKLHPKVQVSIDTFQWGLVFFRKEQVKQHFTIRV